MAPMGPVCIIVPNFVKIVQAVAKISQFIHFSKMAAVRHLEFAGCVWTTHEQYSAVFIAVQSLVAIGAVVSIIW